MSEPNVYPQPLDRKGMRRFIWLSLGGQVVVIHLTKCHYDDAINQAIIWWQSKKGIKKSFDIQLTPAKGEYALPADVDSVVEVIPVEDGYSSGLGRAIDPFYLPGDGLPWGPLGMGGRFLGDYTQALIYQKDLKAVTSSQFSWEHQVHKNILRIFNPHNVTGTRIKVFYLSKTVAIEQLPINDNNMIARYALAWAQQTLSNIWGKYTDGFLGAQGGRSLNYAKMAEDAAAGFAKLNEDIESSGKPAPIMWGTS